MRGDGRADPLSDRVFDSAMPSLDVFIGESPSPAVNLAGVRLIGEAPSRRPRKYGKLSDMQQGRLLIDSERWSEMTQRWHSES